MPFIINHTEAKKIIYNNTPIGLVMCDDVQVFKSEDGGSKIQLTNSIGALNYQLHFMFLANEYPFYLKIVKDNEIIYDDLWVLPGIVGFPLGDMKGLFEGVNVTVEIQGGNFSKFGDSFFSFYQDNKRIGSADKSGTLTFAQGPNYQS